MVTDGNSSYASLRARVPGPTNLKMLIATVVIRAPRNDKNRRDLSRSSDRMRGAFALVREMLAQDPAYRATRYANRPNAVVKEDDGDGFDAPAGGRIRA
jgi:hypothetical protein